MFKKNEQEILLKEGKMSLEQWIHSQPGIINYPPMDGNRLALQTISKLYSDLFMVAVNNPEIFYLGEGRLEEAEKAAKSMEGSLSALTGLRSHMIQLVVQDLSRQGDLAKKGEYRLSGECIGVINLIHCNHPELISGLERCPNPAGIRIYLSVFMEHLVDKNIDFLIGYFIRRTHDLNPVAVYGKMFGPASFRAILESRIVDQLPKIRGQVKIKNVFHLYNQTCKMISGGDPIELLDHVSLYIPITTRVAQYLAKSCPYANPATIAWFNTQ